MATMNVPLPAYGTTATVDCLSVLQTFAYPSICFGNSTSDSIEVKHVLEALSRQVIELSERTIRLTCAG